jgi:tetratricopeptide (TPR) repeat protein
MPLRENETRIPLSLNEWSRRFSWKPPPADIQEPLSKVVVPSSIVEDFRPLAECLEWRLSDVHWHSAGVLPFVDSEVPFLINNTGRLSENAAALLFANCLEAEAVLESRILVAEYGAGTGLFARYLLDAFRALCEQEGRDFYQRLCYLVTDRSDATLRHWHERGLFEEHIDHVQVERCDGVAPQLPMSASLRAVFFNYVLDVLPSAVVRLSTTSQPEQLYVRTRFTGDSLLARQYTMLTVDEIRTLARSTNPDDLACLVPLLNLFEHELDYRATDATQLPYCLEALAGQPALQKVVLNYGALQSLEHTLAKLAADGFILVNDYGTVTTDETPVAAGTQRFGSTIALGLNFPLLETILAARNAIVRVATGDENLALHARLILKRPLPRTEAAFENRFCAGSYEYFQMPVEEARKHVSAGRYNEALSCYRTALSRSPRNWETIGEAADFILVQLRDYEAALELARAALQINPVYSAWLWNVLGDALFCLERHEEAHEAYLQAERIDPNDGRTNLNLTYTYLQFGNYRAALEAISRGLAADVRGMYRDRLLEKQQQVLLAIAARHVHDQECLLRRQQRFAAS